MPLVDQGAQCTLFTILCTQHQEFFIGTWFGRHQCVRLLMFLVVPTSMWFTFEAKKNTSVLFDFRWGKPSGSGRRDEIL